jgi:putative ABC transport system substrate-binding protein
MMLNRSSIGVRAVVSCGLIMGVATSLSCARSDSPPSHSSKMVTVAISQIVDHGALNEERIGILSALKDAGYEEGKNLKLIYQNAQGSLVTATQIARSQVAAHPDVLVAISTPSAQSVLAALGGQDIPMVFTAVSDPLGARLVENLNGNSRVTGVSDHLPPHSQLELVRTFHPTLKALGVIYNLGETNSVSSVHELEKAALSMGISLVLSSASRTVDVAAAAQKLVGKVEAIYVPNDNTAISAIEAILQVGIQNRLPVYTGDRGSVVRGAIATAGYSRLKQGREAGERVVRLLKGERASSMPISMTHPLEILVNPSGAQKMGVGIPVNLPKNVLQVGAES